jgi:hypothetical protein
MNHQLTKTRRMQFAVILTALCSAASAQNTIPQTDPVKAYSTMGLGPGETMRLDLVNVGGTDGFPPDPCNVQMGFVNAAGVTLKTSNVSIPPGNAAFLTLTFAEGSTPTAATVAATRVNIRPVLSTIPPGPCRTVSSVEVFAAILGRTHLYATPAEGLTLATNTFPDPDDPHGLPIFGIVGLTVLDSLRFNVTNITGVNGVPPDPCNVQMGFVNANGDVVKTVSGAVAPGQTAFVTVSYGEALSASGFARLNLRPLVNVPPGPCRISASAELLDALTGETTLYILPAVPPDIRPYAVAGASTNGQ